MKITLFFLFALSLNFTIQAQPDLIWSNEVITDFNYGYSPRDYPKVQVQNNIIKAFGLSDTNNDNKLQQVEYNMEGELINSKFYGIDPTRNDRVYGYKIDNSNNLYLIKYIVEANDYITTSIQKYDNDANLIWEDEIEGIGEFSYWVDSIELLNNDQVFISIDKEDISTQARSQVVVSYDSDGTYLWEIDIPEIEFYTSNIKAYDDNVIVFGFNNYPFHSMITIEPDGTKTVTSDIEFIRGLHDIFVDEDLAIFATHGSLYWLTKLNGSGQVIWSTLYDDLELGMGLERINAFIMDNEGNVYVTGHFPGGDTGDPNDIYLDFLTLKINSDGEILWEHRYHRSVDSGEQAYDLVLKNGFIYVCGETSNDGIGTHHDFAIVKIDATSGEGIAHYRFDNDGMEDCLYSMQVLDNNEIIVTGYTSEEMYAPVNLVTQKLSGVNGSLSITEAAKSTVSIYPNPTTTTELLTIQNNRFSNYSIVTINGLEVKNGVLNIGGSSKILLDHLSAGFYFLVLKNETETVTKKIILQ
ncbi:T9SS type A sorting domain-containing protein [Planktosalinus lacus]|uniref:Secretion system C-terminal sorting domain-containing protein n=1 Tax=Planktosalinus lacus TaxID=1526573 RepID=A0A8J2VDC1_9FLAO|nr:T9SS type A sorting domain-containing protein [Planktosalinus lacus]GGD99781.1 hypothetical protein GCM10011312_24120 [Planktosalinus lacus]